MPGPVACEAARRVSQRGAALRGEHQYQSIIYIHSCERSEKTGTDDFWLMDEHLQVQERVHALYRVIVCPWICWNSFGELCHDFLPSFTNGYFHFG